MRVLHNAFQFPRTVLSYYKYIIVRKIPEVVEELCDHLGNFATVCACARQETALHGKLQVRTRQGHYNSKKRCCRNGIEWKRGYLYIKINLLPNGAVDRTVTPNKTK
jgi:hypothetical protein